MEKEAKEKTKKTNTKSTKKAETKKTKTSKKSESKKPKKSFFKEVKAELKKVKWPERKEVLKYTIATIIFVAILVGLFMLLNLLMSVIKGLF